MSDSELITILKIRIKDLQEQNFSLDKNYTSLKNRVDVLIREIDRKEAGAFMSMCECKEWLLKG